MRLIRSEPCMPASPAVTRVPTASPRAPFPSPWAMLPVDHPPACYGPGSFARSSSPLRSSFAPPPGRPSSGRPSCRGSCPLRGISVDVHAPIMVSGGPLRGARAPNLSLRSALRFSQPRGGLLRRRFRGPVSSRSHVQGSSLRRPGASPVPQRSPARRWTLPPCRCSARAHRRPGCHVRGPRLRGFILRGDAFFGVGD